MNQKTFTITFLSIAAFVVGCEKEKSTSQQLEQVKTETREAVQEMKDYTFAQKAEFTEEMQIQLAENRKDLEQLAAKIETYSDEVKAEANPKIQALREQTDKLSEQLEESKSATESTWDKVKAGFKEGDRDLKNQFQKARQWMSEKIAP